VSQNVFDMTTAQLEEWQSGEVIAASKLNQPVRHINRNLPHAGPPRQVVGAAVAGGRMTVRRFQVRQVKGDYLVCRTLDVSNNAGDDDIKVAKPYLLRRTPFDGETRNGISYTYSSDTEREADDGDDTEDQVVVPSYVEHGDDETGDEIYAIRAPTGGTGVVDSENNAVSWLDLNVDGRAWAQKAEE